MPTKKISYSSQSILVKPIEKVIDDAKSSLILNITGRKLREFPKICNNLDLADTIEIDFSKNRLTEFPKEICEFVSLERIECHTNALRNVPSEIIRLRALTVLNISCNLLAQLPLPLCSLSLKVLNLSNNKLLSLPDDIGRLRTLVDLDVSCNEIAYVPPQIANLQNLRSLDLRKNSLVQLPPEMSSLNLTSLDISFNKITKIPHEFRFLTSLMHLSLAANPLEHPPAKSCESGFTQIKKLLEIEAGRRKSSLPPSATSSKDGTLPTMSPPYRDTHNSYYGHVTQYPKPDHHYSTPPNGYSYVIKRHSPPPPPPPSQKDLRTLSLDATHDMYQTSGGKGACTDNNGFLSNIWNGCRPILTSFKKGREGISEGTTDSGYGTDICSSISNIALENETVIVSTSYQIADRIVSHGSIQNHGVPPIVSASAPQPNGSPPNHLRIAQKNGYSLPQHYGGRVDLLDPDKPPLGCGEGLNPVAASNSTIISLAGDIRDKSISIFDKWCSPFLPQPPNYRHPQGNRPEPQPDKSSKGTPAAAPDLSKFLDAFLAKPPSRGEDTGTAHATSGPSPTDTIHAHQKSLPNDNYASFNCRQSIDGIPDDSSRTLVPNHVNPATVRSNGYEDEFTKELHRQKMHYEAKKKMAEKLRNDLFAPNHSVSPTTHEPPAFFNNYYKPSPGTNSSRFVTQPTKDPSSPRSPTLTTCSPNLIQPKTQNNLNRYAPLARIESFIETGDSFSPLHTKSTNREVDPIRKSDPIPSTTTLTGSSSHSFHLQSLNTTLSSPYKDPRISSLKRFNDTYDAPSMSTTPLTTKADFDHKISSPSPSLVSQMRKSSSTTTSGYKQTKLEREIELIREDRKIIMKLREIIETRLKVAMPEDLAGSLMDGVVLCHLVNHVKPHSISTIHVPCKSVPKLTLAKSKRNVDNFLEACRALGVTENGLCSWENIVLDFKPELLLSTLIHLIRSNETFFSRVTSYAINYDPNDGGRSTAMDLNTLSYRVRALAFPENILFYMEHNGHGCMYKTPRYDLYDTIGSFVRPYDTLPSGISLKDHLIALFCGTVLTLTILFLSIK